MIRSWIAGAAIAVALAACAATGASPPAQVRATAAVAAACESIATGLQAASVIRNRLTPAQVASVTGIRDAAAPICAPNSAVDPAAAVGFVETLAAQLRGITGTRT